MATEVTIDHQRFTLQGEDTDETLSVAISAIFSSIPGGDASSVGPRVNCFRNSTSKVKGAVIFDSPANAELSLFLLIQFKENIGFLTSRIP
jgi:hypothetical protein